jgi:hypothetical protein
MNRRQRRLYIDSPTLLFILKPSQYGFERVVRSLLWL